jgi:hypothetical protein
MKHYLVQLSWSRIILWCYFIWYAITAVLYFDPSPALWLNALGLAAVIGAALNLSVAAESGKLPPRPQMLRLFLIPLCVSSYSSLVKNQGFILIFPPAPAERIMLVGACLGFIAMVCAVKWLWHTAPPTAASSTPHQD